MTFTLPTSAEWDANKMQARGVNSARRGRKAAGDASHSELPDPFAWMVNDPEQNWLGITAEVGRRQMECPELYNREGWPEERKDGQE